VPRFATVGDRALVEALLEGREGAWEDFLARHLSFIHSVCAVLVAPAEVEPEAIRLCERLRADGFALLQDFNGLSSLEAYLGWKLADLRVERILGLLEEDWRRAWAAFDLLFQETIVGLLSRQFAEDLRDGARVEDFYHDACLAVFADGGERLKAFRGECPFSGYVLAVVRNIGIDLHRTIHPRRRLPEAVKRMGDLERTVYTLLHLRHRSPDELGALLRRPDGERYTDEEIEEALARLSPFAPEPRSLVVSLDDRDDDARPREVPDPGPSPLEVRAMQELREAAATLPPDERVFVERYLEDRSYREIAKEIGCSEGDVKRIAERAFARLRRRLLPSEPEKPSGRPSYRYRGVTR